MVNALFFGKVISTKSDLYWVPVHENVILLTTWNEIGQWKNTNLNVL